MNLNFQDQKSINTSHLSPDSHSRNRNKIDILGPIQSKYSTKEKTFNSFFAINKSSTKEKIIRKDIFGNEIKKNGKQKVSFADNKLLLNKEDDEDIENKKECLIEILNVESYKKYNKLMSFDYKGEKYIMNQESVCCESCFII